MKYFHSSSMVFLFVLLSSVLLCGQVMNGQGRKATTVVSPTTILPGENILTFSNPNGIQEIKPMFDSLTASLTELEMLDQVADCSDSVRLSLNVNAISQTLAVRFMVIDCNKSRRIFSLKNFKLILEDFVFPDAKVGDTVCQAFEIGLSKNAFGINKYVIDSIVPSVPNVIVQVDSWPIVVEMGTVYSYTVCFIAREVGEYRFGVSTWQSLVHDAGTTEMLPITDTGVIRVLPKEYEEPASPGGTR